MSFLLPLLSLLGGAALSKFGEKKTRAKQYPTLSPEQVDLQNRLIQQQMGAFPTFQQGQNYLRDLLSGSPESTSAFEAPFMRQYNEQILPQIAERFAGMGSGAQGSSAFQQQLSQSAADLQERIAALRGNMQLQALPQALGYSTALLPSSLYSRFATGITPGQPSSLAQLIAPALGGLGKGFGQAYGKNLASYFMG